MRMTLCCLLLAWCSLATAADVGEPPAGFGWYQNAEAKIAIPLPNGWHVKEEVRDGTLGIFLSEENIAEQGRFDTGYTLNYVKDVTGTTGTEATPYAAGFIVAAEEQGEVLLEPWLKELGAGVTGMGMRYLNTDRSPAVVIHLYLMADAEEDTLRIMIFEAPEAEWESAWKLGEVMLSAGKIWK